MWGKDTVMNTIHRLIYHDVHVLLGLVSRVYRTIIMFIESRSFANNAHSCYI